MMGCTDRRENEKKQHGERGRKKKKKPQERRKKGERLKGRAMARYIERAIGK